MPINSKHRSIGQDNRNSFLSRKTFQGADITAIYCKTYSVIWHNLSISNLPFSEYYCFYCRIFGFFVCISLRGPFPPERAKGAINVFELPKTDFRRNQIAYQKVKQLGVLFTLTVEMGTSMVGGIVVGYYLDRALNTSPWLFWIFFLSGLVVGVKTAVFIVKKYKRLF